MKNKKLTIGVAVGILLVGTLVYIGFKTNIFADINNASFTDVTYTLTATDQGNGDFLLQANIDQHAELQDQALQYSWTGWTYSTTNGTWSGSPYSTLDPKRKVSFKAPGVKYISFQATAKNPDGSTTNINSKMTGIVLIVKNSDGTNPVGYSDSIKNKFETQCLQKDICLSSVTETIGSKIPGDLKIPLVKDPITFFSGGMLAVPVGSGSQIALEIALPSEINLQHEAGQVYSMTTIPCSNSDSLPAGDHCYKFNLVLPLINGKPQARPDYLNGTVLIYPTFDSAMVGQQDKAMFLRTYKTQDAQSTAPWQKQNLTLDTIPTDVQLPKRLTTSFTWTAWNRLLLSGSNSSQFIDLYSKLGFNTVPQTGGNGQPSMGTEAQRASWPAGMKYGPEVGLQYYTKLLSSNFDGVIKSKTYADCTDYITCINHYTHDPDTFNAYAGLNDPKFANEKIITDKQLKIEKTKWLNAVAYNKSSKYYVDLAYDGVFLQKELDQIGQWADTIKPEYVFFDVEPKIPFPSQAGFATNLSPNAIDYQKENNISDADIVNRVVDRFLGDVTGAVKNNSSNTKLSWFGSKTSNNGKVENMFTWDLTNKYNIASSGYYYSSRSPELLGRSIGLERKILGNNYDILPWLSAGTYGEMDSQLLYDHVLHTFLNGATGFSIFAEYDIDDMADVLSISKAIKLVSPHEDLIMDGDLAKDDISNIKNATVSAMKKDGEYLIAATPKDSGTDISFTLKTGKSGNYSVKDEVTGKTFTLAGPSLNVSERLTVTSVYSVTALKGPAPDPSPSPSPSPSSTPKNISVVPNPSPSPSATASTGNPPAPPVPTGTYTFPKGFSTFGTTKNLDTAQITSVGLYVYKFDGANNKWLLAPGDKFSIKPWQGYYVYNPSTTKTITLSYDTALANLYQVTKGWNMLFTSHEQSRSELQLETQDNSLSGYLADLINQNKVNPKVFIIDNDQSKDSCTYFSLLDTTNQPSSCPNTLKKQTSVSAGKAFWVYVR